MLKHIDGANVKMERDKILDVIKTEPKQFQYVLHSIISLTEKSNGTPIFTGDVYNHYQEVCSGKQIRGPYAKKSFRHHSRV